MITPDAHGTAPSHEIPTPFELEVGTAERLLKDPRTRHYDEATGRPATEGATRSVLFGECGLAEIVADGNKVYRAFMTGEDEGFSLVLDTRTNQGMRLIEEPFPRDQRGVWPMDEDDHELLTVAFPIAYRTARRRGDIEFPRPPLSMRTAMRLGGLLQRFTK